MNELEAYRFLFVLLALPMVVFSTCAAFLGLISAEWYLGPNYSVGISTACIHYDTFNLFGKEWIYCSDVGSSTWANTYESSMSALLIIAMILGFITILCLITNILLFGCCKYYAGSAATSCSGIQGLLMLITSVLMAVYYSFSYPPYTNELGIAYYIMMGGTISSLVSVFLIGNGKPQNRTWKQTWGEKYLVKA